MTERHIQQTVERAHEQHLAVATIGPAVDQTILAFTIAERTESPYLDLENRADREKPTDPLP